MRGSRPKLPVKSAILNGFGDVFAGDVRGAGEVGDGARDLEDPVVGPRAEVHVGHGEFEKFKSRFVDGAMGLEFAAAHAGIALDLGTAGEAVVLPSSCGDDALADLAGGFTSPVAADLAELHQGHLDVEVDAVEKRTGDAAQVILDFSGRTARFRGHFSIRSWIHGRHQHEFGREGHGAGRAGDGDAAFLEGLAHGFENAAFELGEFIEKEDTMMGQRDFAGRGIGIPTQQPGVARGWQ